MKGDITINSRQAKYARAFIPNYVFYIPFAYYGVVRMGTLSKFIGFSIYYILPTLYYFLYCFGYSLCGILIYLVSLLLLYNIYEVGYIQNDTETVQKERQPSLRLYVYNLRFYYEHRCSIYLTRIFISIILSFLLIYISNENKGAFFYIVLCFIELGVFLIYNLIRSNWSLVIFILLQIIKYVIYAFYFYPEVNFIVIGMLILVYPVPNIIERFSYKRYNLSLFMNWLPNKNCFTLFRALYFGILSFSFILLNIRGILSFMCYAVFLVIAIFRISLLLLVRKYNFKNYLT